MNSMSRARLKPSVLHLTLHREWFDKIAAGRKKTEYRDTPLSGVLDYSPALTMKFTSEMDMRVGLHSCGLSALAFVRMAGSVSRSDWVRYFKPEITGLGNGTLCLAPRRPPCGSDRAL
jgi:hypothetical protein